MNLFLLAFKEQPPAPLAVDRVDAALVGRASVEAIIVDEQRYDMAIFRSKEDLVRPIAGDFEHSAGIARGRVELAVH